MNIKQHGVDTTVCKGGELPEKLGVSLLCT